MKLICQPPTPKKEKEKEIVFEVVSLFGHSLLPCWQLISAVRKFKQYLIYASSGRSNLNSFKTLPFFFFFFLKFFLKKNLVSNHLDILALAKNTPAKRPERRVLLAWAKKKQYTKVDRLCKVDCVITKKYTEAIW